MEGDYVACWHVSSQTIIYQPKAAYLTPFLACFFAIRSILVDTPERFELLRRGVYDDKFINVHVTSNATADILAQPRHFANSSFFSLLFEELDAAGNTWFFINPSSYRRSAFAVLSSSNPLNGLPAHYWYYYISYRARPIDENIDTILSWKQAKKIVFIGDSFDRFGCRSVALNWVDWKSWLYWSCLCKIARTRRWALARSLTMCQGCVISIFAAFTWRPPKWKTSRLEIRCRPLGACRPTRISFNTAGYELSTRIDHIHRWVRALNEKAETFAKTNKWNCFLCTTTQWSSSKTAKPRKISIAHEHSLLEFVFFRSKAVNCQSLGFFPIRHGMAGDFPRFVAQKSR